MKIAVLIITIIASIVVLAALRSNHDVMLFTCAFTWGVDVFCAADFFDRRRNE